MGVFQWAEPYSPASKVNPICASRVQTLGYFMRLLICVRAMPGASPL